MNRVIHILTVRSYRRNKQITEEEIYVKSC